MKKSVNRSSRGGFTLIEIVVSTALLAVVCTGFLMMTAANAGQLSGEQRLEQSNYNLSALAGEGAGETIAVEFGLEEENGVREIFEQYEITESEEDTGNHMTFYRHR
jgi:prepilin-type N-terminal cleavage/methylation domain-containing protein